MTAPAATSERLQPLTTTYFRRHNLWLEAAGGEISQIVWQPMLVTTHAPPSKVKVTQI